MHAGLSSSSDSAFGMDMFKRMLQTGHPTMLSWFTLELNPKQFLMLLHLNYLLQGESQWGEHNVKDVHMYILCPLLIHVFHQRPIVAILSPCPLGAHCPCAVQICKLFSLTMNLMLQISLYQKVKSVMVYKLV